MPAVPAILLPGARFSYAVPQHSAEETACAKKILTELTKRAYRRPVTDADIESAA